jgi:ribosomal protein S18 acetylase RimI-like enzyme
MTLAMRKLARKETALAARLLGRAMRDNPINRQAFAIADDSQREQALARFFLPVLLGLCARGEVQGAFHDKTLVGVCGLAPPQRCQPSPMEKLQIAPTLLLRNPPATAFRVMNWTGAWAKADPKTPHWHLGPVAVAADQQGHGVGSQILRAFCGRMDVDKGTAYLETDKPENVRFYERFGFHVTSEAKILDIPNWFMTRAPAN